MESSHASVPSGDLALMSSAHTTSFVNGKRNRTLKLPPRRATPLAALLLCDIDRMLLGKAVSRGKEGGNARNAARYHVMRENPAGRGENEIFEIKKYRRVL